MGCSRATITKWTSERASEISGIVVGSRSKVWSTFFCINNLHNLFVTFNAQINVQWITRVFLSRKPVAKRKVSLANFAGDASAAILYERWKIIRRWLRGGNCNDFFGGDYEELFGSKMRRLIRRRLTMLWAPNDASNNYIKLLKEDKITIERMSH